MLLSLFPADAPRYFLVLLENGRNFSITDPLVQVSNPVLDWGFVCLASMKIVRDLHPILAFLKTAVHRCSLAAKWHQDFKGHPGKKRKSLHSSDGLMRYSSSWLATFRNG